MNIDSAPNSGELCPEIPSANLSEISFASKSVNSAFLLAGEESKDTPLQCNQTIKQGRARKRKKSKLGKKFKSIKRQLSNTFRFEDSYSAASSTRFQFEETYDWSTPNLDALSEIIRNYEVPESPESSVLPPVETEVPPAPEPASGVPTSIWSVLQTPSLRNYFLEKLISKDSSEYSSSDSSSYSEHYLKPKAISTFLRAQKAALDKLAAKHADIGAKAIGKAREISKETRGKLKTLAKSNLHRPDSLTRIRKLSREKTIKDSENQQSTPKKTRFWKHGVFGAKKKDINQEEVLLVSSSENISDSTCVQKPSGEEDTFYSGGNLQYGSVAFPSTDFAPMTFAAVVFGDTEFEVPQPATQNVAAPASAIPSKPREPEPSKDEKTTGFNFSGFPIESIESPVLPLFKQKISLPAHLERKYTSTRICASAPAPATETETETLPREQHMPETEQSGSEILLQPHTTHTTPEGSPKNTDIGGLIGEIDKLIVDSESPPKGRIFIIPSNALDCSSLGGDSPTHKNTASNAEDDIGEFLNEDLADVMFDYLDDTEDMVEECRAELFKNFSWKITELLLSRIEEDTEVSTLASPLTPGFVGEIDFYNFERRSARKSSAESHVELFGKVIPRLAAFDDLEKQLNQVGDESETKFDVTQEAHLLVSVVDSYRQIFSHLIRNVVLPCGDGIRKLVREILLVRTLEGELVLDISKVSREISTIRRTLESGDQVYRSYLLSQIKRCVYLLGLAEIKFKKVSSAMSSLENGFIFQVTGLVETITRISIMRDRVLEKYDLFYMLNHNHESFGSQDVHQWTHMSEYKRLTAWHYALDISEFQTLLADNLKILADCRNTAGLMIRSVHENIAAVERATDLREQFQRCKVV